MTSDPPRSPRRPLPTALMVVLALGLLGAAAAATQARALGKRLAASRVTIGQGAGALQEVGDMEPIGDFTFAVVGPIRGNHAALDRAVDGLLEGDNPLLLVLLGDVTTDGTDAEFLSIESVVRDQRLEGIDVLGLPGETDRAPHALSLFHERVSPTRWWIVKRECLFAGVTGHQDDDGEFLEKGLKTAGDAVKSVFHFRLDDVVPAVAQPEGVFAPGSVAGEGGGVGVALVHVSDDGAHRVEHRTVSSAPSVSSTWRATVLALLFPVVGDSDTGLWIVLGMTVLLLGFVLRLLLAGPRRRGTGTG